MPVPKDPPGEPEVDDKERQKVRAWRVEQAIEEGLTLPEAMLFADSDADLGRLRELKRKGWTVDAIVKVLL